MARLGGLELVDGLGIHPYSAVAARRSPRLDDAARRHCTTASPFSAGPTCTLWLTEYGAPAFPAASGWGPALSEEAQAQRLRLAFALATRLHFVENLTWFEYRDSCADPRTPNAVSVWCATISRPSPRSAQCRRSSADPPLGCVPASGSVARAEAR